jgi:MFS family permease
VLLALISFMGMPLSVLMPVFATKILQGGADTLGYLMAASGFGALIGALYLAAHRSIIGMGRKIFIACLVFGTGLIGFSFSHNLWLSMLLLFITGAGMMIQLAASNTVLQTIVDDDKRGRVMSFYTMAFLGMAPFGSLVAGSLADRIGAPNTVLINGLCCIIGGILFGIKLPTLREAARPILVRMGIIPEVAMGLQSAAEILSPPED